MILFSANSLPDEIVVTGTSKIAEMIRISELVGVKSKDYLSEFLGRAIIRSLGLPIEILSLRP
jgi:hypothetical protein